MICEAVAPLAVNVAVCAELLEPTGRAAKVSWLGASAAAAVGVSSKAPRSMTAVLSPLPSERRGLLSKSAAGRPDAELSPASTAGEAEERWKSLLEALKNSGSAEKLPDEPATQNPKNPDELLPML